MTLTTIHLMRHGEVDNPEGILYGRLPGYALTVQGQAMAQAVAQYLRSQKAPVTHVVASPLLRAQMSAAPTAQIFDLPVRTDARLLEADNSFEGVAVNRNRAQLAHPKYWWRYRNPFKPSWSEPYTQIVARMRAAVSAALHQARGSHALLVSHQLPIWTLRSWVEGKPLAHDPRKRECALASLTSLTFDDDTLVGLRYVEPAASLLIHATDMVPGTLAAELA